MMAEERRFTRPGTRLEDLELAWQDRCEDADVLKVSRRHASAIVMGLYAVEIALKVRICRKLSINHLPKAFEIHDLDGLLLLAGLSDRILAKAAIKTREKWEFIVRTSQKINEMRYTPDSNWTDSDVSDFFESLDGSPSGFFPWLKRQR